MNREFLKSFNSLTDEEIEKIIAEHGKAIQKEQSKAEKANNDLETANNTISNITTELQTLKDSNANAEDWKKKYDELKATQDKAEAERQKAKEDAELTDAITAVFGDRKFTSDYVRNGIIADMKSEIARPENKGKGYSEIFAELTKDKDGIFQNPNPQVNIPGISKNINTEITKEQFSKMGYSARTKLFNENRELYNKLNEE